MYSLYQFGLNRTKVVQFSMNLDQDTLVSPRIVPYVLPKQYAFRKNNLQKLVKYPFFCRPYDLICNTA